MSQNVCIFCESTVPNRNQMKDDKFFTPWTCVNCGTVLFNQKPLRDLVFVWPIPLPKTVGDKGLILRATKPNPEDELRGRSNFGVILAVGEGWTDGKGKFHPCLDLHPGDIVLYDKRVFYGSYFKGEHDEKKHYVVLCGYQDVWSHVLDLKKVC